MNTSGALLQPLTFWPTVHHPPEDQVLKKVPPKVEGDVHSSSKKGESPPVEEVPTMAIGRPRPRRGDPVEASPPTARDGAAARARHTIGPMEKRSDRGADLALADTVASDRGEPSPPFAIADEVTPDSFLQEAARVAAHPDRLAPLPDLQPDQTIGPDRYRIIKLLGKGGFGAVYEAQDVRLRRSVALKVLTHENGSDEWQRRFRREALAASAVTHKNIAAVYDAGEDAGRSYIAMELVRGQSLRSLLKGGLLPLETVTEIAKGIAAGLSKAHAEHIVHRDIKPGNILLSEDGDVKILDFGLAKDTRETSLRDTFNNKITISAELQVMGTPHYMSPEQARAANVDVRSDVFSFGIVLYEMVTGSRPFDGEKTFDVLTAVATKDPTPPSAVNPRTPPELERIILRCLQRLPEMRYANGAELLEALERPVSPRPASVPPLGRTKQSPDPPRKRRSSWLTAPAIAFVAGALITGVAFWVRRDAAWRPPITTSSAAPALSTAEPAPSTAEPAPPTSSTASASASVSTTKTSTPEPPRTAAPVTTKASASATGSATGSSKPPKGGEGSNPPPPPTGSNGGPEKDPAWTSKEEDQKRN